MYANRHGTAMKPHMAKPLWLCSTNIYNYTNRYTLDYKVVMHSKTGSSIKNFDSTGHLINEWLKQYL